MAGIFTLSIDLELAWGEFYRRPVDTDRLLAARQALPELLRLLERYRVRATFAVVGHLLLEGCDGHPDWPRPALPGWPGDWLSADPASDERRDPAWYAPSLVRRIAAADPGHEIGGHGFSHLPLDLEGVTPEVARAEIGGCARLLGERVGSYASFVYPRNGIMYGQFLREYGFGCFRQVEDRWYGRRPAPVRKVGHMIDQWLALTPPVGRPRRVRGVVEVPSSMLFLSREGFRRWMPMAARVRRARRGLDRAAGSGQLFHLWMHAEDLVPDADLMLAALEAVLVGVRKRMDRAEIEVRTMAELGEVAEG